MTTDPEQPNPPEEPKPELPPVDPAVQRIIEQQQCGGGCPTCYTGPREEDE